MIKCLECGDDVIGNSECICGSRNSFKGNRCKLDKGDIICGCGSREFEYVSDYEFNGVIESEYECKKCGRGLGVSRYL